MTPELLQALTAAKGLPMPIEDARPVNAVAELIRKEKRLRELLRRLEGRTDAEAEHVRHRLVCFTRTASAANTRSLKQLEWTHAECAQACQGLEERYWQAMRYTYALDDSVFHSLSTRLWEWALWRREQEETWPKTVMNLQGDTVRFMRDLVDIFMLEVRRPSVFLAADNEPDARMVLANVTERVWRKRLSPIYEAIGEEFLRWLSIAAGHMRFRLRDDHVA